MNTDTYSFMSRVTGKEFCSITALCRIADMLCRCIQTLPALNGIHPAVNITILVDDPATLRKSPIIKAGFF